MGSDDSAVESPFPKAAKGEGGRESLSSIVGEIVRDLRQSQAQLGTNGQDLSTLQRYRDVISSRGPRLNRSLKYMSTDLIHWMNRGGQWRAFFVLTTGSILLVGLSGVSIFLLFLIIATVNTVIVGLLGSLAAVGAVTALFFTALTGIYIGALAVATCVISTIVFFTVLTVLVVSGWLAFWWVVWLSLRKVLRVAQGSLAFTATTLHNASGAGMSRGPPPVDKKFE